MAGTNKDDLISIIEEEGAQFNIPTVLPLMPIRDIVVFSDMLLPLFVGRDSSVNAVDAAIQNERFIFLVTQKDSNVEDPKEEDVFDIGTVCRVLRVLKLPDGRVKVLLQGVGKGKVIKYVRKRPFYKVKIEILVDEQVEITGLEVEALMRNVREHSEKIMAFRGELSGEIGAVLESIGSPGKLADLVASNLRLKHEEAQELLEMINPVTRLGKINDLLVREVAITKVQARIQTDVTDEITKNQRDYFLREQVRAIHKELGDGDDKAVELKEYDEKIKKAKMPKDPEKEARKQLKRFDQMHADSSEASLIRTYLDWLVEMPWSNSSKDVINIVKAKTVLDNGHFGLAKVKDRILEYLSVRKLNPSMKGPILCFTGPPGVGKTSLGRAIAKAMKRKFVRISLGGIHDEAEIRGHRRTYIGALPGRILQGLKQCGTNNPVFMLDEIDKLGNDYRGDPSSALLEALDPEQNSEFSDHFLNMPFDLSKVMFILTANITDTIPSALYDRMEVITISGYTSEEKEKIAIKYLLPRQLKDNGLAKKPVKISDGAIKQIIDVYTAEAGLRNLEREFGKICRKIARKIAEGQKGPFTVTKSGISKYLGPPRYLPEMDQENSQIGLSTGLAWTQTGGEALYVEVALLPGKGELIITGQLGEIMQESVRAAVSYARANVDMSDLDDNFFETMDVHIHVPAGAIPKDGPSAGIAIATALISAITERPVNKDIAMTGEITLRGRVLPIGGLKEKALGALRAGIKTIIIPEKNRKDLPEIPANVNRKITFIPVQNVEVKAKAKAKTKSKG
ncbi:MAG: endopeptidase La [Desulfobacteraceae bacterium 4572_19]|nr:MAG: endopeptidase La [Desulfobacteraceae bacterium 4572_19]